MILVTHDMSEAFALAHRIGVLDAGQLVVCDSPEAVARSRDPRVTVLLDTLGSSSVRRHVMSELLQFWLTHRAELARLLEQHIVLVVISTGVAALLGIPAGILAFRRPRLGRPLLFLANVAQTIPSLALFGFLLPLPFIGGIGPRTALVTLTLYALLPIVRTTVGGLQSLDRSVVDAGVAMGMTPRQLLFMVELPLALPSIVAGLRVATVIGVGTATIAAAIGAGGLGEYIFRGLSMVDSTTILAGALPAAALALVADGGLAWLEHRLRSRRASVVPRPRARRHRRARPRRLGGMVDVARIRHERRRRIEEFHRTGRPGRAAGAGDRGRGRPGRAQAESRRHIHLRPRGALG